jgi:hypothetical protein
MPTTAWEIEFHRITGRMSRATLLDTQPALAKVIAQTTGANTERFVHAPRGIHAMERTGGTWSYMLQDGLGSCSRRNRCKCNGAIQVSQSYAPYGQVFGCKLVRFSSPFAFTGEPRGWQWLAISSGYAIMNPMLWVHSPSLDPFEGVHQSVR